MVGAQVPRIRVVPDGDDHPKWDRVVGMVARLGVVLDPWQWDVLRVSLRRAGGLWAAFAVAVCAPRQNGKNAILEMRELAGCLVLGERLVIHTAHLSDTSMESFRRMDDLVDANDWLAEQVKHVHRTNGRETIEFTNGSRIRFRTRTKGGGRGFAGSPVLLDEPMFLPEMSMKAILPVMSAQPDPQVWYTGSAVDQMEHEDGLVFARVRDRALNGDHERLAYFEWSLDVDTPAELEESVALDPDAWAQTNPALGLRITPEYIRAEFDELDLRGFAVERLGVGDWPLVDGDESGPISRSAWDALADAQSVLQDPVCLAFDVSPNRKQATICAAGRNEAGRCHVEIVTDARAGAGWVVDRVAQLVESHEVALVVCDAVGPAASLVQQLEERDVKVETVTAGAHAQACGQLVDLVADGDLVHLGQPRLDQALRGAKPRALGDAFAWSRKSSSVDITPLVAATLALSAAASVEASDMVIF